MCNTALTVINLVFKNTPISHNLSFFQLFRKFREYVYTVGIISSIVYTYCVKFGFFFIWSEMWLCTQLLSIGYFKYFFMVFWHILLLCVILGCPIPFSNFSCTHVYNAPNKVILINGNTCQDKRATILQCDFVYNSPNEWHQLGNKADCCDHSVYKIARIPQT